MSLDRLARAKALLAKGLSMDFVQFSERNLSIADAVGKMADEIGATAAQVALSWIRQRGVIPIIGARKASQLKDGLACLSLTLTVEHMQRLHEVSQIDLGFPHEFLARKGVRQFVYGGIFERIDNRRRHLALDQAGEEWKKRCRAHQALYVALVRG